MVRDWQLLHNVGYRLANSATGRTGRSDSEFRATRDQSAGERGGAAPAAPADQPKPVTGNAVERDASACSSGSSGRAGRTADAPPVRLGLSVATAESCTGGMLAALLTDIEGAGHGFDRGFVTYTKELQARTARHFTKGSRPE